MKVLVNDAVTLVSEQEVLTEGTVNARKVQFDFSREWEGLNKTAVFTNGVVNIKVLEYKWEEGNVVSIPPEVLAEAHRYVQCGIFGEDDEGKLIFPTIWAKLGKVLPAPSSSIAEESVPPTPTLWEELQLQIGNLTHLDTENKVNLVHAINEILGEITKPIDLSVDYTQNDPTAEDFIKNRPFYVSDEVLDLELPSSEGEDLNVKGSLGLKVGNIYTVFDGEKTVEIEAIDFTDEVGFSAVGLPSAYFTLIDKAYFLDDTEEVVSNQHYYVFNCDTPLRITGIVEYIKKIEDKFLPDSVVTDEKLRDFKDKYIDYTSLYSYDVNNLSEIKVTPDYPCFKVSSELVDVRTGYTVTAKDIWVIFDIVLAKVNKEGEIIRVLESPLDIEYEGGLFNCPNIENIKDTFIVAGGDTLFIGEAFKDMVENNEEVFLRANTYHSIYTKEDISNGEKVCILHIMQSLIIALGDVDGVPYCDIIKQEIDDMLNSYDGIAGMVYLNEPVYDIVNAQYIGGRDE